MLSFISCSWQDPRRSIKFMQSLTTKYNYMAITIRTLSKKANEQLAFIMQENEYVNSKTKAIQLALEKHQEFKPYAEKYASLAREYDAFKREHGYLISALNVVKQYTNQ